MALTSQGTFDVTDQATTSESLTLLIEPPVGYGTGGRGRLTHPTLGVYDYANTPSETVNIDGDVCYAPVWASARTLGGAVHALWDGYLRDPVVVERWLQGDTGGTIGHLRQLWQFYANPPDPAGTQVLWEPNYANASAYWVIITAVRAGGEEYTLDRFLAALGYAPAPVELEMRVLSRAST